MSNCNFSIYFIFRGCLSRYIFILKKKTKIAFVMFSLLNEFYFNTVIIVTILVFSCNRINLNLSLYNFTKKLISFQTSKITTDLLILTLVLTLTWNILSIFYLSFIEITNSFFLDYFIVVIKFIFLITIIVISNNIKKTFLFEKINSAKLSVLLVFITFFLNTLLHSANLISFFIVLFGASIILYSLIGINKNSHSSRESVSKYFLLSAFTSGIFSFSLVNFLFLFKTTNYISMNLYLSIWQVFSDNIQINWVLIGSLLFFCTGLFFKLSAFPGHLWVVDVYQGSTNSTMSVFLMPTKLSIFFASIRVFSWVFDSLKTIWQIVFFISSILSMLWGCVGAILELHFKKFVAYSSVNQIGFFFIGISCLTFLGNVSSYIYIYIYMFTNIIFFIIYLNSNENLTKKPINYISQLNSLSQTNFVFTVFFAMTLFSMGGIPPFSGFFVKFFLFAKAFQAKCFSLVLVGMFTSLISTFYYLNVLNKMWFIKGNTSKKIFIEKIDFTSRFFLILSFFFIFFFPINSVLYAVLCINNSFSTI